jgi:hypothetical protein
LNGVSSGIILQTVRASQEESMRDASGSLNGLRKEMLEFMRSSEALLGIAYSEALTEDEVDIIRHYVQWLSERCTM